MKKQLFLPVGSVAVGAVCFALRLLQNKTGFESSTGLPVPGNIPAIALLCLLGLTGAVLFFRTRTQKNSLAFPADFSTQESALLTLPVMGILLLAVSGLLDAFAIARPGMIPLVETSSSPSSQLLFGVSAIAASAALFYAVSACREHTEADSKQGFSEKELAPGISSRHLLLAVPACLVVRLVLSYRIHSVNPSLEAYYVELLALVVLTLAFFRLASCSVQPTPAGPLAWYSAISVILCLTVMADPLTLSARLLYVGCCLTLLGFLILQNRPAQ